MESPCAKFRVLAVFFLLLLAATASAKSYSVEKAEVYMQVRPNALVTVEENLTFAFFGNFAFAYRDIPKGAWELSDVQVLEAGRPLQFELLDMDSDTRIRWIYSAANENRTFTIKYTLRKAVTAYTDVAELYWKVWGSGWDVPLGELYGWIELPAEVSDPNEVYTWGHPQLNGKIGLIENRKVLFQAFNIPKEQFVEIHIAFPVSLLSSAENAVVESRPGLESIIRDEVAYAFYGVAYFYITALPIIALAILQLALFAFVWHRYGREPGIKHEAVYEREVPYDYSPAVVSVLMSPWSLTPRLKQITAEILDLCLKGKLKLEQVKEKGFMKRPEFKIHIKDASTADLPLSEAHLLNLLKDAAQNKLEGFFLKKRVRDETPNELLLSELEPYLKSQPLESRMFADSWKLAVKDEAEEMGFFSKRNGIIPYSLGSFLIVLASMAISLPSVYFVLLLFEAGWLPVIFPNALPNRTEKGALHHARWSKLKKFLKDFSSLKDVPPTALPLWEKYLVYSIPLGIAKQVQKSMGIVFADYRGTYHSAIFIGTAGGFSLANFGSAVGSSFSAFSSAAGTSGSGGFGGGGGRGGGGGGGGAG